MGTSALAKKMLLSLTAALIIAGTAFGASPAVATDKGNEKKEAAEVLPPTGRTIGGPGIYLGKPDTGLVYSSPITEGESTSVCITVVNRGNAAVDVIASPLPPQLAPVYTVSPLQTFARCFDTDNDPGPSSIELACHEGARCLVYWRVDKLFN